MKNKNIKYLISFLIIIGISIGYYTRSYCRKCIVINADRDIFYKHLSIELEEKLKKLGYNFDCPNIFPKTKIDFLYTNINSYYQKEYKKREIDTNIALVGDCFDAFDIELLKKYDYLLIVSENRFGYTAMFNFKAIHFPISINPNIKKCRNLNVDVDILDTAKQLDDIIQRTREI